jgi:hypothetical protein
MAVVAAPVLLSGCASQPLQNRRYDEKVSSILVSQDRKHIVFFGASHHYVFDTPPDLIQAFDSPLKSRLRAHFSSFTVKVDRSVEGHIYFHVDRNKETNESIFDIGRQLPREWSPNGTENFVTAKPIVIRGKRYESAPDIQPGVTQRLNHIYSVSINEVSEPAVKEVQNYSSSPISNLPNGLLMIFLIPLLPFIGGICFVCGR